MPSLLEDLTCVNNSRSNKMRETYVLIVRTLCQDSSGNTRMKQAHVVFRERLRAVFAEVITVDVLDSRDATHLALLQRPELGITFTKIHCWNLTQYEKCVFLDADTLVRAC